jgi:hypothetical protein
LRGNLLNEARSNGTPATTNAGSGGHLVKWSALVSGSEPADQA